MRKPNRAARVAGVLVVVGGGFLSLAGCNTGGGLPQQLEPTKPRMDKEKETDRPVQNAGAPK